MPSEKDGAQSSERPRKRDLRLAPCRIPIQIIERHTEKTQRDTDAAFRHPALSFFDNYERENKSSLCGTLPKGSLWEKIFSVSLCVIFLPKGSGKSDTDVHGS